MSASIIVSSIVCYDKSIKSKMAAGAILKILLPALELNSECRSLNQKCCVSWSASMQNGSLLFGRGLL